MKLFYDYSVKDVYKKNRKKTRLRKCNSYVQAFIQHLYGNFYHSPDLIPVTITKIDGTNWVNPSRGQNIYNGASSDYGGVMIGTGTTAVSIDDYALETLINHGTGAGELQYSLNVYGYPSTTATTAKFIISRTFTNGSGNNITIEEITINYTIKTTL